MRRFKAEIKVPMTARGWAGGPSSKEENGFHLLQIPI